MAKAKAKTAARSRAKAVADDGARGGFTIIEVVLVLAIAGLIFLMVFIALPALQRSQRDTQRRSDLARVSEQITNYQTNNNGRLPADSTCKSEDMPVNKDTGKAALPGQAPAASDDDEDEAMLPTAPVAGSGILIAAEGETETPTASLNEACRFIKRYMNAATAEYNEFTDPDGDAYGIDFKTLSTGYNEEADDYGTYMITVVKYARCDGESAVYDANSRNYAVLYDLEGSGSYCQDNQ